MYDFDDDEESTGKSRSQKKRDSAAAQKIGVSLTTLPETDLNKLELPAALINAIADWKSFPGHEAKRRQLQYIGKLMREMDTDDLQKKLDALLMPSRAEKNLLHEVEKLRDTLIALEGEALDEALNDIAARLGKAPVAKLRHLVAVAQDERRKKRPPKAYRELFRLLKEMGDECAPKNRLSGLCHQKRQRPGGT